VDGTGSSGDYFEDTFSIAGATLTHFEMGLATDSTIGVGIMGIGYNTSEANVGTGNGTIYANLPQAMQDAGLINANAYSLWLDDLRKFLPAERKASAEALLCRTSLNKANLSVEASTGTVLFGGIDTKKYTGDLISVQIYPSQLGNGHTIFDSFTVAFTSLSASSSSGTDQVS
jgi:hypothetical protein